MNLKLILPGLLLLTVAVPAASAESTESADASCASTFATGATYSTDAYRAHLYNSPITVYGITSGTTTYALMIIYHTNVFVACQAPSGGCTGVFAGQMLGHGTDYADYVLNQEVQILPWTMRTVQVGVDAVGSANQFVSCVVLVPIA